MLGVVEDTLYVRCSGVHIVCWLWRTHCMLGVVEDILYVRCVGHIVC
jgi:hypothetical protein